MIYIYALIFTPFLCYITNIVLTLIIPTSSRSYSLFVTTTNILACLSNIFASYLFCTTKYNFYIKICTLLNYTIAFSLEPVGIIFLNMILFLCIAASCFTNNFLKFKSINNKLFLIALNLSIISTLIIGMSDNLMTMFIGYEFLTLSTIPLIIYSSSQDKLMPNIVKYVSILLFTASVCFLPAILITYIKSFHISFIPHNFITHYCSEKEILFILMLFIFGTAKTAIIPFHNWLPSAMIASYPVSALLHSVLVVKSGLFCIFKIIIYIFGIANLHDIFSSTNIFLTIPVITIIYSCIQALRENELKKIFAYSTINQLSLSLLSLFLFTQAGAISAIIHMLAHSFTKILIFYSAGFLYITKKTYTIDDLPNSYSTNKMAVIVFTLSTLSLIGVPPFAGFVSKYFILKEALNVTNLTVVITVLFSSVCSALCFIKPILRMYQKNNINSATCDNKHNNSGIKISLYLCGFCMIIFFIPLVRIVQTVLLIT